MFTELCFSSNYIFYDLPYLSNISCGSMLIRVARHRLLNYSTDIGTHIIACTTERLWIYTYTPYFYEYIWNTKLADFEINKVITCVLLRSIHITYHRKNCTVKLWNKSSNMPPTQMKLTIGVMLSLHQISFILYCCCNKLKAWEYFKNINLTQLLL
jgi:hypothetical protein